MMQKTKYCNQNHDKYSQTILSLSITNQTNRFANKSINHKTQTSTSSSKTKRA